MYRLHCKASVYKKPLDRDKFRTSLEEMLNKIRLDYLVDTPVRFQYFYDLLLKGGSDELPNFRIFRGFYPEVDLDSAESDFNLDSFDRRRAFWIRTQDDLGQLTGRIRAGLSNEEYKHPNFEGSEWKVHSCVNVIVTAALLK